MINYELEYIQPTPSPEEIAQAVVNLDEKFKLALEASSDYPDSTLPGEAVKLERGKIKWTITDLSTPDGQGYLLAYVYKDGQRLESATASFVNNLTDNGKSKIEYSYSNKREGSFSYQPITTNSFIAISGATEVVEKFIASGHK